MWLFWLILAGIAFLFEILTPGALVSAWFTLAALIVSPLSFLIESPMLQVLLFGLLSVVFLLTLRPILASMIVKEHQPTNTDRYIGKRAKVIQPILPDQPGYVRLEGIDWSAVSYVRSPIKQGEMVTIEGIDGIKLIVRKEDSNGYTA